MSEPETDVVPTPTISRKARRISWIWLVPIVAALAGASLVFQTWLNSGPTVSITFNTAAGLEVGKTQLRYKDVTVGTVTRVHLSEDWSKVVVTAEIAKEAASLAREGTRFWVVRPRLALSGVSGLGTLLSGAYIEVDAPGADASQPRPTQRQFIGLEEPPEITHDRPGRRFVLQARDLGSLDIGSPVYYRRLTVGRITDYELDPSGQAVTVEVFIDAPNDQYVTTSTRFWNASGIDVDLGASGLKVHTQSMVSLLLGGIAFDPIDPSAPAASADAQFLLHDNETAARAEPDGEPFPIRMRFERSVRGLEVGAPIDFKGINLGKVTRIEMDFDDEQKSFFLTVDANLYPLRLGAVYDRLAALPAPGDTRKAVLVPMMERGLRAQLRTANLLTGQLYVALDFFPDAQKVGIPDTQPLVVATVPGEFDQLQQQLSNIVTTLEKLPLEDMAANLNTTLVNAGKLLAGLDKQLTPEAQKLLRQASRAIGDISKLVAGDAALPMNTQRAMEELARAARSLRILTDYLQANPEALLRGRTPDALPGAAR